MNLVDQILEGFVCLKGEEGEDFIYYETLLEMLRMAGVPNPHRNLC